MPLFSQDFESGLGANETTSATNSLFGITGFNANGNGTQMMGHGSNGYANQSYDYYQISNLGILANTTLEFDYVVDLEDNYDRFNIVAALTGALNPPNGLLTPDSGMTYTDVSGFASATASALGDTSANTQSGHAVIDLSAFAGSSIDIRFQFGSDGGVADHGVVFDNISINVAASVPEPATIGMLGIALAGLGLAARRRKAT